jgi:predicted permease
MQSLRSVRGQPTGFAVDNVFVATIGLPANPSTSPTQLASAEQAVLDRLAALPNVRAVAAAYDHPLGASWSQNYTLRGEAASPDERHPGELRIVSPGYFQALELALVDGRVLNGQDNLNRRGAVVVNEAFAREVAGPVLGRHLRTGLIRPVEGAAAPDDFEIVGVVGNERFRGLEQPSSPAVYMSTKQFPQQGFVLLVRTVEDPLSVADEVRVALRALDPGITMNRATSLSTILSEQLMARRVTTDVIGGFAGAALAIAALGMYGLLALLIASRRTEIGVRLALGASPAHVARRVLGESLWNAAAGTVLGCALALASGRLIESLLVGVTAWDARTLTVVAATMLGVAVAAAIVPAVRAARIDPVYALRSE